MAFLRAVPSSGALESAMLETLRLDGFIADRNLTVLASDPDEVYPDEQSARLAIGRWQRQGIDLIVATSTIGARTAQQEAAGVDTLFIANDPVATGLIDDPSSPGGSVTGVTFRVPADRTLDLIRRAIPGGSPVGLAFPVGDPAAIAHHDEALASAERLGMELIVEPFDGSGDVVSAISRLAERGVGSLLLSTSPTASMVLDEIEASAATEDLPVIANSPLAPWAVISLYPDSEEIARQLGRQASRLLSGATPAAVPVEDPRSLILELNAVAAAEHGIVFPESLMREAHLVRTP